MAVLDAGLTWIHSNTLATLTVAAAVFVSSYTVYALWLHPLARYPGPWLGRLTQAYDAYHSYKGDKHILLYRLHQKYGTIVRYSPNTLSINDPAVLRTIYAQKNTNVQKSVMYKCFRAGPQAISTLLATDKNQHARKRRVMGQAFSDTSLRGLEQYVLERVQEMIMRIGDVVDASGSSTRFSKAVDMQKYCNWLVFDIMGDLVFGKSFGTLGDKPENREGIFLLGQAARRNYTVGAMPSLIWTRLEQYLPGLRTVYADRLKYLAFGKAQVIARTQNGKLDEKTGRKDIFSFLLHARDPYSGEGFAMPELWMEGNTLIVAGSDTTSTTMAAALYYLLKNPETLKRLEKEVRTTFARREDIRTGILLQSCAYLRAVLDETMRMSPAVPGLLPREVLAGGLYLPDMEVRLPAGTVVGTCVYSIHHHADFIWEPFRFDPSRWLSRVNGATHPQDLHALHSIFNPFSLGNRACLGKPLVYMELEIALARLVWEFDMKLAAEQHVSSFIKEDILRGHRREEEYHTLDWFLSRNEGPWVDFRRRGFSAAVS